MDEHRLTFEAVADGAACAASCQCHQAALFDALSAAIEANNFNASWADKAAPSCHAGW
jgi:hypothetical protein